MKNETVQEITAFPVRHGKVRDVYDVGERVVLVASDRISAFDHVLPTAIPNKGKILTAISQYWADVLLEEDVDYHEISRDVEQWPAPFRAPEFAGRTMFCRKAEVIPFECIVRGYLTGSAWKEYQSYGTINGERLPPGLKENFPLPRPYFTPTTKAESGHDESVTILQMSDILQWWKADYIIDNSVALYLQAARHLWPKGLLVADTKFEWGVPPGMNYPILIDEILTPDSSRFWPVSQYCLGAAIPSYDKQYVRDWLAQSGWDKESSPPSLPDEVVEQTCKKYVQAYEIITGKKWT